MTTEEMLLQLIEGQKQTNQRLDKMDERFDKMDERFDKMEERLDKVEDDLEELKEHAYITREATNALIGRVEAFVKFHNENDARKFKF